MAKHKKKGAKKGISTDDVLDMAALSIKRFRRVTKQIGKLSTGQKIVGGLALLAAGLTYLSKQQPSDVAVAETNPSEPSPSLSDEAAPEPAGAKLPAKRGKKVGSA